MVMFGCLPEADFLSYFSSQNAINRVCISYCYTTLSNAYITFIIFSHSYPKLFLEIHGIPLRVSVTMVVYSYLNALVSRNEPHEYA